MSSYKSLDLFGSGPHRFAFGERGIELQSNARITGFDTQPGRQGIGDIERVVTVTGRLVAATAAGLRTLRDALIAEAALAKGDGALVDGDGVSHAGLWFVSYAEDGPVDRGRVFSVGYIATFRDLTT